MEIAGVVDGSEINALQVEGRPFIELVTLSEAVGGSLRYAQTTRQGTLVVQETRWTLNLDRGMAVPESGEEVPLEGEILVQGRQILVTPGLASVLLGVSVSLVDVPDELIHDTMQATPMSPEDFMELAKTGSPEEVRAAIASGTDVNVHNEYGWTPLDTIAVNHQNPEVVKALMEAGAKLNDPDEQGITPLMMADRYNQHPAMIRALVEMGAELEAWDEDGWTPLMWAAMINPNPEVVRVLLEGRADVEARDPDGKTAFDRHNAYSAKSSARVARTFVLVSRLMEPNLRIRRDLSIVRI